MIISLKTALYAIAAAVVAIGIAAGQPSQAALQVDITGGQVEPMPIALGIGTDPSFRAPMAIVVIGGLITSTFLSLLVIPVLYTFVDDVVDRSLRLLGRRKPAAPADPGLGGEAATP